MSFLFFFVLLLILLVFAENTIKIGVSAKKQKQKKACVKTWSKVVLKNGPSMLRNKIGPVVI